MSRFDLTSDVDTYTFNSKEFKELTLILADLDKNTVIIPVISPADLLINSDSGKTSSGYNFTNIAFKQICGLVIPGLYNLIEDLSGQWRKPGQDKSIYSVDYAIEIFNKLVKMRYNQRLLGLQLVKNTKTKTIDGVVGARYRYIANSDLLNRVESLLKSQIIEFHEAGLYGRQFLLRYKHIDSKHAYNINGSKFYKGYHFANAEIGGHSIRTTVSLIIDNFGFGLLFPFVSPYGGRVIHSGKDFERKLANILSRITEFEPNTKQLDLYGKALNKPLGLSLNDNKRFKQIALALSKKKLPINLAENIVKNTATRATEFFQEDIDLLNISREKIVSDRTYFDLFLSLMIQAQLTPLIQREIIENIAQMLLFDKVKI